MAAGAPFIPIAALAQRQGRIYRIGFLGSVSPTADIRRDTTDHLWQGLRELGWDRDRNIVVEERWANGKVERLPQLAEELVGAKPDIIVAGLLDSALAAKQATSTIPIVTVVVFDPVRHGLIASYSRPGGNVTGLSYEGGSIGDKLLDLLCQAVPGLKRIAVLWNPDTPSQRLWLKDMEPAARQLKLDLQPVAVRSAQDFEAAFASMRAGAPGALLVFADAMMFAHRERIAELATRYRLPSISVLHEFPERGGLIGYVSDIPGNYRRAAIYVDRILRGAKPADLAVEQPTRFTLTLNLRTARAIGLTLPQALLVRADRVIE